MCAPVLVLQIGYFVLLLHVTIFGMVGGYLAVGWGIHRIIEGRHYRIGAGWILSGLAFTVIWTTVLIWVGSDLAECFKPRA